MMPGPYRNVLLLWLLIVVLPPAIGRKGLSALIRSHPLPLIRTLLDHGPLKPRMAAKHDLSLQHLRFMLELYKRSADGNGRPKMSKPAGAAVRLMRPVSQASFIMDGQWRIQNLTFNLHNVKVEELMRTIVMHPRALRFGENYYFCKLDLLPSAGPYFKTRVHQGIWMWAETEITSHIKPLVENPNQALHIQLICRRIGKQIRRPLAVSASHIPFLLFYFNHTFHNPAKEKETIDPEKDAPDKLIRRPRQAGTIGIKLPKIPNQSGQSKNHCSLRPFWVSFHQLGWDHWIIAPHRYNPGYCKGDCPRLLHSGYNSPNHAIIQNFINQVVDGNVPRPSCVPYSYGPISVLMIEPGGNILYKEYENMMAESCTCR
ncbi:bone morphogenetic protein 15 [Mixophyes fleayi]|uniref:bone morphogenetic protein 15 n=1 Tax=Mixophyes fleayi TaxID=3061075 RepID=UPI003F4D7F8B